MFDSLYSVVNWTGIHLHLINAPGPNWLGQSKYAMAAVIAVNVWRGLPFFAITTLAGLMAVPRSSMRPPRWTAPARGGASGTSRCP